MVLDELSSYLQAQGLGVVSTTLFKARMPEDDPLHPVPDEIVWLIEGPGLPPVHVHSQQQATYVQPVVQILNRGIKYGDQAARLKAQQIFLVLDGLSNITLSGVQYLSIFANQEPYKLREDDQARPIFSCNYRCAKALTS